MEVCLVIASLCIQRALSSKKTSSVSVYFGLENNSQVQQYCTCVKPMYCMYTIMHYWCSGSLNEVSKEGRKRWVQVLESNKNTPLKGDLIIILYGDVTMSRINVYVLYGTGIEQNHPIVVGFDTNCHYHHLYYNLLLLCCCYYLCS